MTTGPRSSEICAKEEDLVNPTSSLFLELREASKSIPMLINAWGRQRKTANMVWTIFGTDLKFRAYAPSDLTRAPHTIVHCSQARDECTGA